MVVTVTVPTKAQIVSGGFGVAVAGSRGTWSKRQLGDYPDRRGVYVHHAGGKILYVGKTTTGPYGTFGERLRREFQKSAAGASQLYRLLAGQTAPIRTYLLDLDDLDMMVDQGPMTLPPGRKALIMEQVLIGIFEPEGNHS